jgi:hypothetical protein
VFSGSSDSALVLIIVYYVIGFPEFHPNALRDNPDNCGDLGLLKKIKRDFLSNRKRTLYLDKKAVWGHVFNPTLIKAIMGCNAYRYVNRGPNVLSFLFGSHIIPLRLIPLLSLLVFPEAGLILPDKRANFLIIKLPAIDVII